MFRKKKVLTEEQAEEIRIQDFFDRIIPGTVRFFTDHFICGNHYKCVWAVICYTERAVDKHPKIW